MNEKENIEADLHLNEFKIDCLEDILKDSCLVPADQTESTIDIDNVQQIKSYISNLKYPWWRSQVSLWISNGVEKENLALNVEETWLNSDDQTTEHDLMKKEKKEDECVKINVGDNEANLEQLSENIQEAFEKIKAKKLENKQYLSIVKGKMEKLKGLRERKGLLEKQKNDHFCQMSETSDMNENLLKKAEKTEAAINQCKAAVRSLVDKRTLRQSEQERNEKNLSMLKEKLSILKTQGNSHSEDKNELFYPTWSSCGIRVVNVGDACIEFEISDLYEEDGEMAKLSFTLYFGEDNNGVVYIERIMQTDGSTSFIKTPRTNLRTTDELKAFFFEVQKRFHNQVKLSKEIHSLQKRFAIDWNEEEQKMRVMLGKCGQIVCTLRINGEYPTDGFISVEGIQGADANVIFLDSVVTGELKTLSNWINYLDLKYGSL